MTLDGERHQTRVSVIESQFERYGVLVPIVRPVNIIEQCMYVRPVFEAAVILVEPKDLLAAPLVPFLELVFRHPVHRQIGTRSTRRFRQTTVFGKPQVLKRTSRHPPTARQKPRPL